MNSLLFLRLRRRALLMLALAAASTLLASGAAEFDLFDLSSAERNAYDTGLTAFTQPSRSAAETHFWQKWQDAFRKKPQRSDQISIVAIDDRTFQEIAKDPGLREAYGAWPYTRTVWANAITKLRDLGAQAVVLDAVVDEPHSDPSGDLAMAEAIGRAGVPFYVGFSVTADPSFSDLPSVTAQNRMPAVQILRAQVATTEDDPFGEATTAPVLSQEEIAQALAFPVHASALSVSKLAPGTDDASSRRFLVPVPPLPELIQVGPGFGLVLPEEDPDGKMRSTHFAYSDGKNSYVTLSVAVAADLLKARTLEIRPGELLLGQRRLRINANGSAGLDYGGRLKERFATHSLVDLLRDRLPKKEINGRVVFIAGFATGTADSKITPFASGTPGVVKPVTELDSLLAGRFITEAPYGLSLFLAFAVALFSAGLILGTRSTALEMAWPVALFFGFFLVTGSLLVYAHTHLLSAMPALAGSLASVAATAVNHLAADRRAERTRETLSRYMEPQLVAQLVERGEIPQLGGESREITAFFSDIRGFSSFSEKWRDDPQRLVRFLNQYLTRVTQVLFDHKGCVDKYIGDAVVCLFGAPFAQPDHALHACRAALAVQAEIERMRSEFRAQGLPDVYTRIGLNTDVMFVGNFGSEQIFDFTAMGDGMNLASRLEGANKNYGSMVMMGENTFVKVATHVEARELDWVRVAGKSLPTRIYELIAMKGGLSDPMQRVLPLYEKALALYRQADFASSLELLKVALEECPDDGPSQALRAKCEKYLERSPAMPFDGVTNLEK